MEPNKIMSEYTIVNNSLLGVCADGKTRYTSKLIKTYEEDGKTYGQTKSGSVYELVNKNDSKEFRSNVLGQFRMFEMTDYYKVKGEVAIETSLAKDYTLDETDILTKNKDGTFTKHTGICMINLKIPEEHIVGPIEEPIILQMM